MGGDSTWWNNDPSDHTETLLSDYSDSVKDLILREGQNGFVLGDPKICDYTVFQICILDPHKETPESITIFADDVNKLFDDPTPSKIAYDSCSYDSNSGKYNFAISIKEKKDFPQKKFAGEFDRNAYIVALREVVEE